MGARIAPPRSNLRNVGARACAQRKTCELWYLCLYTHSPHATLVPRILQAQDYVSSSRVPGQAKSGHRFTGQNNGPLISIRKRTIC